MDKPREVAYWWEVSDGHQHLHDCENSRCLTLSVGVVFKFES